MDKKIIYIFILIFLLILSAFFSASETAYSSVSRAKLEENLEDNKPFRKKIIIKRYEFFPSTLSTILIGNNIVNIAASILLSSLLTEFITDDNLEIVISTLIMTPLIVIFGEIIPKIFAQKYPVHFLKKNYLILSFFYYLFWPVTILISKIVKPNQITNTENELKQILNIGYKEGVLEKEESILAKNALDFDSIKVYKHFIRIKNTTFVSYDESLENIKKTFKNTGFSRIPVSKNNKFIGIILLKDIFYLEENKEFKIDDFIVEVPYISSNSLLKIALKKLKENKSQFAFITKNNDDKKVIGILTFEDILEELVGEIYDEHDFRDKLDIYEIEDSSKIIVNYSTEIEKINDILDIELDENFKTIGDFLVKISNKKLTLKFKYSLNNIYFKVVENKRNEEPKIEIWKED
ncbi:CNNM domain-containing protein [Mesomycoplasma molare]|uniref:Hemolysin family protein n=1 Tax=Mesomycoplasma molare TaxID=171288 RepID=A0ABY5TVA6_9BACT|nr:hemolysin family protein [Mesomycoplasma molare]UWD34165.1 hemolysin family protein [Mesomycoplasma molare]